MGKIVGNIKSKNSMKIYKVKWDSEEQTSWISVDSNTWEMVCTKVKTAESAIKCAQRFIDTQFYKY